MSCDDILNVVGDGAVSKSLCSLAGVVGNMDLDDKPILFLAIQLDAPVAECIEQVQRAREDLQICTRFGDGKIVGGHLVASPAKASEYAVYNLTNWLQKVLLEKRQDER